MRSILLLSFWLSLLVMPMQAQTTIPTLDEAMSYFDDGKVSEEEKDDIRAFIFDAHQGRQNIVMPENHMDIDYDSKSFYPIYNLDAALQIGFISYRDPRLGINPEMITNQKKIVLKGVSCASCHVPELSFFSGKKNAIGLGGFGVGAKREFIPDFPLSEADTQAVTTPSSINVFYGEEMLWAGLFGATGNNADVDRQKLINFNPVNGEGMNGVFAQAVGGQFVHNIDASECLTDDQYLDLIWQAYRIKASREDIVYIIANSLMLYQFGLITNQAPFQKYLRGDNQALEYEEYLGSVLMVKYECHNCHNGPALGNTTYSTKVTNETPFSGRMLLTGNPEHCNDSKAPTLYNCVKDKTNGMGCEGAKKGLFYFKKHDEVHHFGADKKDRKIMWKTLKRAFYDSEVKKR